jgi:hypothetical protein
LRTNPVTDDVVFTLVEGTDPLSLSQVECSKTKRSNSRRRGFSIDLRIKHSNRHYSSSSNLADPSLLGTRLNNENITARAMTEMRELMGITSPQKYPFER